MHPLLHFCKLRINNLPILVHLFLLAIIALICLFLGSYSTLPKVLETAAKITEIKTTLKTRIFWSFRELGQFLDLIPLDPNAETPNSASVGIPDPYLRGIYEGLYDVSGVLNCLGTSVIDELTDTLGIIPNK